MTSRGVDVSSYQSVIDWRQLRIDGVEFAYARTCDGETEDAAYVHHTTAARVEGLLAGGYQYGHPSMDLQASVDFFLARVSMRELRPAIDMETLAKRPDGTLHVPDNAADWTDAWCEKVKAALASLFPGSQGAKLGPLVYASSSYMATMRVLKPAAFGSMGWDWWAAEYRGDSNPSDTPPAGSVAWQYAGDVPLKGQVGLWDLDVTADLDRLRV